MKTYILSAFVLFLIHTTLLETPTLSMEKGDAINEEEEGTKKPHSPFLKLRTHPRDFTWADMTEVMHKVNFEKVDPKNKTKSFMHRLEDAGYYFTIKSKKPLKSMFDNFSELTYRLQLVQEPTKVMLDTQLMYEIIIIGSTGEKMVANFSISYVHESMVKIATQVPFIKTLQKKRSRKAHTKFLEGASSKLELLSTERKDLKERTERSEQNAQEAKEKIDAFYAVKEAPKQVVQQQVSNPSEEHSTHSSAPRTRSRLLGRVRAKVEEEKQEKSEQKAKEARETIDAYYFSLGSTPRKLSRSIAKTEDSAKNEEDSTAEESFNSSSDTMSDLNEETDDADSSSFE